MENNSIYCISGKAFSFLYKNKDKKQCKILLEKIHQNCKIFYCMSSLDKSLAIDFYRDYPNSCICTLGKYQNDYDAIITSNIGINLSPPKNENTILCHFYSADSNILSIKKIIREGRAINENILLLKITGTFYTLMLNSYIVCHFYLKLDISKGQLNFLEICFLILSISGFTTQYDSDTTSNPLIHNKKLFICHYIFQIAGIFFFKMCTILMLYKNYLNNSLIDKVESNKIFCTYYFILCVEQLFSITCVFNFISFYRKNPLKNTLFVFFIFLIMIYFSILISLNSSNFKYDILKITHFEFNEDLIDSFDDNNRIICFGICGFDLTFTIIYSNIIYYIFDRLAKKNLKYK